MIHVPELWPRELQEEYSKSPSSTLSRSSKVGCMMFSSKPVMKLNTFNLIHKVRHQKLQFHTDTFKNIE